jgi:hypothetical protein
MKLSPTPDFSPWRRMLLAAAAASLIAAVVLAFRDGPALPYALGDTDDAMRVVMMRALAGGQGWWDQNIVRLQPPHGVFMHWSRLIDGGLVALDTLFRLGLSPAAAEIATRFTWPMLWILPTVWAATAVARRLGGSIAIFAAVIVIAIDIPLFLQFRPGRVDHHNLQICMAMLAFAGAALGTVRGGVLAGFATGLGLCIGLEALAFEVVVGAYFAILYLLEEDDAPRKLRAYAVALALSVVGFYLIQTPPWRWGLAFCDAIGVNLAAALAAMGAGLALAVQLTKNRDWRARLPALALVGLVTVGLYVGLDPNCLHGPFADVDPRLKTFWLPNVQEIRPIPRVWRRDHETPYLLMVPCLMGALAWAWLALDKKRKADPFLVLAGIMLLLGTLFGWNAIRMAGYASWFAVPIIAAAVAAVTARYFNGAMVVAALGACLVAPIWAGQAAAAVDKQVVALIKPKPKPNAKPAPKPAAKPAAKAPTSPARGDRCFRLNAYADLARLPPGLALSEIDLGPFVLAYTPSSSMTAPYHRMNWGLVEARNVLSMPAEQALAGAQKLGVTYVLECPAHGRNADRVGMKPDSLQKQLDAGKAPSWLEPLSVKGVVRVYRVRAPKPQ